MKRNTLKTYVLVMGIALGASGIAFGQSQKKGNHKTPPLFSELLEEMDSGKDGKFSAAEVKGPLKEHFGEIDANEDGYITEEEFNNRPKPKTRAKKGRN